MDAADVAYCAYVYEQKKEEYGGRISGVRIFDGDGNPYQGLMLDRKGQRLDL